MTVQELIALLNRCSMYANVAFINHSDEEYHDVLSVEQEGTGVWIEIENVP